MQSNAAVWLAFGDTEYNSLIFVGQHKKDKDGIYTKAYIPTKDFDLDKMYFNNNTDYYITPNTLNRTERKKENLYSLKNIVIDIDIHNDEITYYERQEILEEFFYRLERDLDLPAFNLVHFTGRGLQLWYCLEEEYKAISFIYIWVVNRICATLESLKNEYSAFDCISIDAAASKNLVGYFRLFGTYNTKTGTRTQVRVNNSTRYKLKELLELIEEPEKENTPHNTLRNSIDGDFASLNHKRLDFIKWLIESRNAPEGQEQRDLLLLLYYNAAVQVMSREMAKALTLKLNKSFKQPLDRTDNIFNYINKIGFLKFRNETFCSFLNLDDKERSKYMEQKNSNYVRDKKRQLAKEERNSKVLELNKQGKTYDEIMQEVGISRATVSSILKKYNKTDKIDKKEKFKEYLAKELSKNDICKLLNISVRTYYRLLKDVRGEY